MAAGPPLAAFTTLRAEAEAWAALADDHERAEYMRACWLVLSTDQRRDFVHWLARLHPVAEAVAA